MRNMNALILGGLAFLSCRAVTAQEFPKAETLEVTEVAGNYVLKVPVRSLVVTIPKGGLVPAHNPHGGGARDPRYFYFKDDGQNLIVTGWFEPAEAFKGTKQLWADESATFKRQGLPEPEDVSFVEIGKWNVVFYDHRLEGMRSSHLRAEWVQAGTWIDVHISITGILPQAEHRAKLRQVLSTIQVTEKPFGISVVAPGSDQHHEYAVSDHGTQSTFIAGGSKGLSVVTPGSDQREINISVGAGGGDPRHEYAVPGHGKLSLLVPGNWKDFSKPQQVPPALHLRFRPPSGDKFYVQVTAVWLDAEKCAKLTPEKLRANVQQSSVKPLLGAVEKEVKLQELRGEQTVGYYYSLTDRNPPPEEYKYMTQGISLTGEIMVIFTILQREDRIPDRTSALQMLANATYSK